MRCMDITVRLKTMLREALVSEGIEISIEDVPLEPSGDVSHGDYASGVALKEAKRAGKAPKALAESLVKRMGGMNDYAKTEVAGPGFINFTLTPKALLSHLEEARRGVRGESLRGVRIMAEYTDPNPFKEFHIGHLMNNSIGESISRLLEYQGASMIRANYQGDIGLHVAKAMYVLLEKKLENPTAKEIGTAYVEGSRLYDEDADVKLKIDALNVELYAGEDAHIKNIYLRGKQTCLDAFEKIYALLGTKFDYYFFESETAPRGIELVKKHPEVFEESQGAVIFPGEKYSLHTRVFLTRAGLPTYEAKDLGLASLKRDTVQVDRSITVTASEQNDYFAVVKKAIELCMPELVGKIEHQSHGMMRFAEGKMSSRKGNIITGESLLADMREAALERAGESRALNKEELAGDVAVAAIKYQILKQSPGKDIVFDRERALSLEGDSGPYIQYAYARTCAILEKAKEAGVAPVLTEEGAPHRVARIVVRFPGIAERAAREMAPQLIASYAIQLAAEFNSWYANEQILDGTPAARAKVALVDAVSTTLKQSLSLLGIPAPQKM